MNWNKGQRMVLMLKRMAMPGGVPADELRQSFDLDPRSFRRYISDLRDIGVGIVDVGRGAERVLHTKEKWQHVDLRLSLAEVLAFHFGRTSVSFLRGTRFADNLDDALMRLRPALSAKNWEIIQVLNRKFISVAEQGKDYSTLSGDLIDVLLGSLVDNLQVEVVYRKPSGVERRYVLEPYSLATFRQGLYLFARDAREEVVKTFAVERFLEIRGLSEAFLPPEEWSPQAHIEHAFGIISGTPVCVKLAFSEWVLAYIQERTWHPSQRMKILPNGRLELSLEVANTVELRTWILGFGKDVVVLEPSQLASEVAANLRIAAGRYPCS